MKRKDNNSGFFLFWRGAIMQLKITTDYAIRIVYYLACRSEVITASELAYELKIPESYIPKITKKLKEANIITACEGIKGGYSLAKKTEDISLFDIISATEITLEEDGFCSRNATEHCKVHKILLDVQQTYDNLLKGIKVSEIIKPDTDELSE